MEGKLYSGMWLPLAFETKLYIAKKLSIPRNGASHVVNNRIQADGYLEDDLNHVTTIVLQRELSSTETDFFKLWADFLAKVEKELTPVVSPAKEEEKPHEVSVSITINKDGDVVTEKSKVVTKPKKNNAEKSKTDESTAKTE